jgi:two-component system cell cycle response regulator
MREFSNKKRLAVWAVLTVAVGGTLAHLLHTTLGVGGSGLDGFANDWVYNVVVLAAAVACLMRAAFVRADRAGWLAIGAGALAWAGGEIYWTLFISGQHPIPSPSPADAMYLAYYPLTGIGIALLTRSRIGSLHSGMWLDGAIGALATAALGAAVLGPALHGNAIDIAYPVVDAFLISLLVGVVAMAGTRRFADLALLGAGIGAVALADVVYLDQVAQGSYVEGTAVDSAWLVGAMLTALAAWRVLTPRRSHQEGSEWSLVVPGMFATVALSLEVYDKLRPLNELAIVLAIGTLAAVVLRLILAFGEIGGLLQKVRVEASTDSLTGLLNRRRLLSDLEEMIRATEEASGQAVFALFDLDGFKAYNDSFGHGAGDLLLQRLGHKLDAAVSPFGGKAYRLGGDEFCVLAADPGNADAIAAAAAASLCEEGKGFEVHSSKGVVALPHEAGDPSSALRVADRRMYTEKGKRTDAAQRQAHDVLLSMLREREPALSDHLHGVAELAELVGQLLGLDAEHLDVLHRAAELHDIGKLAIPDSVLHKRGPLDEAEWDMIYRHTLVGERILDAAPALRPVAQVVRATHERWDGDGYPDGVAGDEIPLGARIIFACDAFDAMTTEREYQRAVGFAEAVAELRRNSGTQFDPAVVEAVCEVVASLPPGPQIAGDAAARRGSYGRALRGSR